MVRGALVLGFVLGLVVVSFAGAAHADGVCGGGGNNPPVDARPPDGSSDGATALRAPGRNLRAYGGGLVFVAALGGIWMAARRGQDGGGGDGDRSS